MTNSDVTVRSRHDYFPFGEEVGPLGSRTALGYGTSDGLRQQFTSYERDTETGLDFAQARYYGSSHARFTSVDPVVIPEGRYNPQSWNKYTYTLNNPLQYIDPDGRAPQDTRLDQMQMQAIKRWQKGEITTEELNDVYRAQAAGGFIGLAIVGAAYAAPAVFKGVAIWAARNPDKYLTALEFSIALATGNPLPGAKGTLTIATNSRLSAQELRTGARFAKQSGVALAESTHVGEEFRGIWNGVERTFDAYGGRDAFKNWGDGTKALKSLLGHVRKANDYTVVDLEGASAAQIKQIQEFVRTKLTAAERARIVYVSP